VTDDTGRKRSTRIRFFFPVFYAVVFLLVVLNALNIQTDIKRNSGPLYKNLREAPAYVRRGFDRTSLDKSSLVVAADGSLATISSFTEWVRFPSASPVRRIMTSPLPDLPKRTYLSPFGKPAEEFTMVFLIELNDEDMAFMNGDVFVRPGFYFAGIGENWEFFLNGKPVYSEMHLDENGQIKEHRTWREIHFPADSSLFVSGTNVLALRIVGDPTFKATGPFYNSAPIYMDDYRVIEKRQHNFLLLILGGFCISAGVYYLLLFFSIKSKSRKEIYSLFFGIFSVLLCIYAVTRNGMINFLVPNSFLIVRLEYSSLLLMIPVFGLFIETFLKGRITKISKLYMGFCSFLTLTQIIFCDQYGEEIVTIWDVTLIFYLTYIVIYDIIYFLYKERRIHLDMPISSILIGIAICYFCGLYDIIDALFIRSGLNLFQHSVFVVHIGMAFALSQRFSVMYKQLEQSNVILETTVQERTLELIEQTEIAIAASRSKSEFLATMSHEIKTPLTVISVHVQQAARLFETGANAPDGSWDKETIATSLRRAQQELMRASGITENALRLASMEEGHKQMKALHIDTLLTNSAEAYRAILEKRNNKLNLTIAGGIGLGRERIYGNADQLIQVMVNILSNANRHTTDGIIDVKADPDNGYIKITVTDNGSGIAPELLPHVFERGVSGTGGTGFGLEICKKIIESHEGTIAVDSESGKGTAVILTLPIYIDGGETDTNV
jgi:signal transduction histidine kinase